MERIVTIFVEINNALNTYIMPAVALMGLVLVFCFVILLRWIKNNGLFRGLYLWILATIPVLAWGTFFCFGLANTAALVSLPPHTYAGQ